MKRLIKLCAAALTGLIVATGCSAGSGSVEPPFRFTEIGEEAGITFVHEKETFDDKLAHMMPWMSSTGAAVAIGDYNNDGWMDVYFANSKTGSMNRLYRNNQDGTFTDVAEQVGLGDVNRTGISETALWFDYDNDGDQDLFIGTWGTSMLFENDGAGTFTEVTQQAGVGYEGYVAKAITLDYNLDGHLDLYLGCYFHEKNNLWNLDTTVIMMSDFERATNGGRNVMLRNNGDGTFSDVSAELGVDDTGWTLATGAADLNGDGYPDIYNANDFGPDVLYINEAGVRFNKIVQRRGIGDDTYKGMNVDFADVFHDGRMANYISNISKPTYLLEGNQLWHMQDNGVYADRAEEMGVHQAGFSWGAKFFDADNSGNYSLMVTNGFISASTARDYWFDMGILATTPGYVVEDAKNWHPFNDKSMSGYEQKFLFWNDGNTFHDVAAQAGITFVEDGRGVAAVDLFNRGTLDLVFVNQGGPSRVYRNEANHSNNWIKLELVGASPSSRDAVGAKVVFKSGGKTTVIERDGGNSHGGQSDPRIHYGLGAERQVEQVTIHWPSGRVQTLHQLEGEKIHRIEETHNESTE